MSSRYDRADPGLDEDYCDSLSPRFHAPREATRPLVTAERTMHDLHKAMHDALALVIASPCYGGLAVKARTLLADLERTIGLQERH